MSEFDVEKLEVGDLVIDTKGNCWAVMDISMCVNTYRRYLTLWEALVGRRVLNYFPYDKYNKIKVKKVSYLKERGGVDSMCGIFGSFDRFHFLELYTINLSRGGREFGGLFFSKHPKFFHLIKTEEKDVHAHIDRFSYPYTYYLGHTRAPTNTVVEFGYSTSHPFIQGNWCVAHNGVILNFNEFKARYRIKNEVDSSCIPFLLDIEEREEEEVKTIQRVLERLRGVFACWIMNLSTMNVYLVRCGAPIWYIPSLGFTSVNPGITHLDKTSLEEGVIYKLNCEMNRVEALGEFKYESPYL